MILGLDLGTTTGYALVNGSEVAQSGVLRLPGAEPSRAYSLFREFLEDSLICWHVLDARRVDLVAYEAVPAQAHAGGDAAHRWGGWEALLLAECERAGIRYLGVPIARWKKAAGLRSGSSPADALAAARKRWPGYKFATADEAVARWIAVSAAGRTK